MRRIAAVAASLVVGAGVIVAGTVAARAATCTGTGTVEIVSLTLNPPAVAPGGSSTATLVAQNCTGQPIQAAVQWTAQYVSPAGGIPSGCPVIDPALPALTLPANGQATSRLAFQILPSCTATGLQVTASVQAGGSTLASQSAALSISGGTGSPTPPPPPPATCAVGYARLSEWPGGFVAQVTVADTGTAPISGWTLAFTFPGDQTITNAWNAAVSQSGTAVSATNVGYNRVIGAGASASFGFQGTWRTGDASPTAFTLNGAACTAR